MNLRYLLAVLAAVWIPGEALPQQAEPLSRQSDRRPNVVLVVTDDQGWGDVHSHGNSLIDTPVMDRLAEQGARFDRFFVSPMCGPSRASFLTGRYNLRTGAAWVSHGLEVMRLNEVTIADALAEAGYATGAFGKWHNGEYGPYHPNYRGFQEFFGFCRGAWENYFDAVIEHNREPVKTNGYITDVLTDAAREFIERNRSRPFFCYVPYNAPHHPFQVPAPYVDKYRSLGFEDRTAAVYGMVENIDENLGRILRKIDELNLAQQTIVIFTSDNGPARQRYNGGMRGIKAQVDEGGVRVPFFIRWPGHIKPGTTVTRIAAHVDVFPTLIELCGVESPETLPQDGRSLVPLLNGDEAGWPGRMIFAHQNRFGETLMTPGSVRTERYRLVNRGNEYELFDMIEDPAQKRDVAGEHPDIAGRLTTAYENWYQDVTSGGFGPQPAPVGHPGKDAVAVQAEDSKLHGRLKFARGQGWAHDSVVNWRSTGDYVVWDLDVLRAGQYEVTLRYSVPEPDAGATIQIDLDGQKREATVDRAHDPKPPSADARNRGAVRTSGPVWVQTWAPLAFPPVDLTTGPTKLVVRASQIPGKQAFELKEAHIRWVE